MIVSSGYRKRGFDAYGGKVLKAEDFSHWNKDRLADPAGVALQLDEEIEVVELGVFDILPTLYQLWIKNPKCKIYMSEDNIAMFQRNNVLIRGQYGTGAENFAQQYHLQFLPLDIELAQAGDYFDRGVDIVTLRFYDDGSAYIHQDCRCQGISAGNTGGGEVSFNLPDDFYRTMTADELADKCWLSGLIKKNGVLASVMKKAKAKGGFLIDYTKKEKDG